MKIVSITVSALALFFTSMASAANFPSGYIQCATERGTCSVGATPRNVSYGGFDKWVIKRMSGNVPCNNATFGDPLVGKRKVCAVEPGSAAAGSAVSSVTTGPIGFGRAVTGGAGGARVRVSTPDQLRHELCHTMSGGLCSDNTPRIIEIATVIDFAGSEGIGRTKACYANSVCTAPNKTEATLQLNPRDTHCSGKSLFDVNYDKAGVSPLLVGSNKTLIGVGANAGLKGKGLMLKGQVRNIAIRNLSFTDINQGLVFGGDAITVADASRVWIDHNRFARIGRQMIVTGTGDYTGRADEMTISWNEFDGRNEYSPMCNGKHYWNLLFYGNGNVTFANNWLHDFTGRGPLVGHAKEFVHLLDNYFEDGAWHALDSIGGTVRVLVEGNTFKDVVLPIRRENDPGNIFAIRSQSQAATAMCSSAIGRACSPNTVNPPPSTDNFVQDSAVLNTAKSAGSALAIPGAQGSAAGRVQSGAGVGKI